MGALGGRSDKQSRALQIGWQEGQLAAEGQKFPTGGQGQQKSRALLNSGLRPLKRVESREGKIEQTGGMDMCLINLLCY